MRLRLFNNLGYGIIEIMMVASLVGVVPITVYIEAQKSAKSIDCISNLRNIYMATQMYEMDFERLPDAKFYPEYPKEDPKSITNILGNYVDDKKVFICPSMPLEIASKSLTYIWNDNYNNKLIDSIPNKSFSWLMTDMTAVDSEIPPPHQGSYNVVFLDGHVKSVKEAVFLPPSLAQLN
ncbi:MAG: hypothetical protein V1883_03845 [Candidatus Omnitrophota bacterium]